MRGPSGGSGRTVAVITFSRTSPSAGKQSCSVTGHVLPPLSLSRTLEGGHMYFHTVVLVLSCGEG